jgi:hypothetical protein
MKTKIVPNLKGYIVDLRNNPGGLLDQAIAVSDAFLDKSAVVLTRGRNPNDPSAPMPGSRSDRREEDRGADQRRLGLGDRRRRPAGSQAGQRSSALAPFGKARCRPSSRSARTAPSVRA